MCVYVWYYLRLILGANHLLLHVQTFYKQRLKNTKAWVQCMPLFFFFFQGCQPLLFKDLTLALQSNKKPFGKLISLSKLFRFLMQLNVKCSILALESSQTCLFVSPFFSFPVSDLGPFAKAGAEGAADFFCWALLLLRGEKMPVWQLQLCVLSWEFNFLELVTVVHLASIHFLASEETAKNDSYE